MTAGRSRTSRPAWLFSGAWDEHTVSTQQAAPRRYDVITMGRVGVDVYPLQVGVGLEDVETFGKFLGGSATNVAVAAARHGRVSALITPTRQDPLRIYAHKELPPLGGHAPLLPAAAPPPPPRPLL